MKYTKEALQPKLEEFLKPVLAHAGFNLSFELKTPENPHPEVENPEVTVHFAGPDVDLLLENRAELLLALEHLSMEALRLPPEDHSLISFDANDYRLLRMEELRMSALAAGYEVLLLEQEAAALERGASRIHEHYDSRVKSGKTKPAVAAADEARLSTSLDWPRIAEADLVIEAVFEELGVKQQVFQRIDALARPGAVLASNTSYLDLDAIAAATSRPQDVIGLHFFSPANVMKLMEIVRGKASAPDALATGLAVGRKLKKLPVLTGNAFGFVGNRLYAAYRRQCEFMVEEGASPEQVDAALEAGVPVVFLRV